MRRILVGSIRIYQLLAPKKIRDRCIFKISCSEFVLQSALESGFLYALARLRSRMRACRPGYYLIKNVNCDGVHVSLVALADGSIAAIDVLNDRTLQELGST